MRSIDVAEGAIEMSHDEVNVPARDSTACCRRTSVGVACFHDGDGGNGDGGIVVDDFFTHPGN